MTAFHIGLRAALITPVAQAQTKGNAEKPKTGGWFSWLSNIFSSIASYFTTTKKVSHNGYQLIRDKEGNSYIQRTIEEKSEPHAEIWKRHRIERQEYHQERIKQFKEQNKNTPTASKPIEQGFRDCYERGYDLADQEAYETLMTFTIVDTDKGKKIDKDGKLYSPWEFRKKYPDLHREKLKKGDAEYISLFPRKITFDSKDHVREFSKEQ